MTSSEMRVTLAVVLCVAAPAGATGMGADVIPNFVGFGVGVTPQWMGATDTATAMAPAARWQFQGERFLELYGPIADVNVLDVPNWEFGPMVSYRFGRKDVDD